MLDFDILAWREPYVFCFINPGKSWNEKLFFWDKEIIIPVFSNYEEISSRFQDNQYNIDTLINFASFRSTFLSTKQALELDFIKNIIIIFKKIFEL